MPATGTTARASNSMRSAEFRRILRRTWSRPYDFSSKNAFVRFLSPPLYARRAIHGSCRLFLGGHSAAPRTSPAIHGTIRTSRRGRLAVAGDVLNVVLWATERRRSSRGRQLGMPSYRPCMADSEAGTTTGAASTAGKPHFTGVVPGGGGSAAVGTAHATEPSCNLFR
jgi:hypothetical protein